MCEKKTSFIPHLQVKWGKGCMDFYTSITAIIYNYFNYLLEQPNL